MPKPMREDLPRTIRVLRHYMNAVDRRGGFIDSDFVPTLRAALHHLESQNDPDQRPGEQPKS